MVIFCNHFAEPKMIRQEIIKLLNSEIIEEPMEITS